MVIRQNSYSYHDVTELIGDETAVLFDGDDVKKSVVVDVFAVKESVVVSESVVEAVVTKESTVEAAVAKKGVDDVNVISESVVEPLVMNGRVVGALKEYDGLL